MTDDKTAEIAKSYGAAPCNVAGCSNWGSAAKGGKCNDCAGGKTPNSAGRKADLEKAANSSREINELSELWGSQSPTICLICDHSFCINTVKGNAWGYSGASMDSEEKELYLNYDTRCGAISGYNWFCCQCGESNTMNTKFLEKYKKHCEKKIMGTRILLIIY